MNTSWPVTWRSGPKVPDRFKVGRNTIRSILHSIEGLDPHNPVFETKQCYHWKLWSCLRVTQHQQITISTPDCQDTTCTKNLRFLLLYHYTGLIPTIQTSSRKECPCKSGQTYGKCCFPTVFSTCATYTGFDNCGLCVNPLHMKGGRTRDEVKTAGKCRPNPTLQSCTKCTVCDWTPYEFAVSNNVRGINTEACHRTLPLNSMEHVQQTLTQWKKEGLENQMEQCEPHSANCIARYIDRYCQSDSLGAQ